MPLCALFLPLLFLSTAAWSQSSTPCALVVPNTVTANSEQVAQATCPCHITNFEATVHNRWAAEVWSGKSIEGFPGALLNVTDLQAGTYLWKVKYTAVATGTPVALEATGYLNVLK